jgi:hypothetical protein
MARVSLYFEATRVVSPQFGNWPMTVIRLIAEAEFRLSDGSFTEPLEAIFDTGAPLGVLPPILWRTLDTEIHVPEATFGGISRRKVCQIPCSIGTVHGQLRDEEGNFTGVYDFPAFLARADSVPLILGFAGLLEKFTNHFDYQTGEAWIEER